jgi:serine/alanine adding enzyme
MEVKVISWDEYSKSAPAIIHQLPNATYADDPRWTQVVKDSFGLEVKILGAFRDNRLCGLLPLFQKRRFRKTHGLTTPFCTSSAGLLANDPQTEQALLQSARHLVDTCYFDYVLVRSNRETIAQKWKVQKDFVTFHFQIPKDRESLWSQALRAKTRNQVRKAENADLTVKIGHENLASFFRVLHAGVKQLGAPIPPLRLFQKSLELMKSDVEVFTLYHGDKAIGGSIVYLRNLVAANPWTVVLKEFNQLSANTFLYWQQLLWAHQKGCRQFDFGRARKNSGPYFFKRNFNAHEQQLYYYYYKDLPARMHFSGEDSFLTTLIRRTWSHLPDPLTLRVGPFLYKELL